MKILGRSSRLLITLLLAVWMPWCCCSIRAVLASADPQSPCSATVNAACCCREAPASDSETPGDDECGQRVCCIRGLTLKIDWSPPVDQIGLPAPALSEADLAILPPMHRTAMTPDRGCRNVVTPTLLDLRCALLI